MRELFILAVLLWTAKAQADSAQISASLRTFKPALAVRGINCLACHGDVRSNVITDLGYDSRYGFGDHSPNFLTAYNFTSSGVRTPYNDSWLSTPFVGGWQTFRVAGTVFVPTPIQPFPPALGLKVFNSARVTNFVEALTYRPPGAPTYLPIARLVQGNPPVAAVHRLTIGYPKREEILALLPSELADQPVAVAAISVPGVTTVPPQLSGLAVDATGLYVTNSFRPVDCIGDVVVKGTLFLNNLILRTNEQGCRLYVSQSVFIQGPIKYIGDSVADANVQISSSGAIILGISAIRLGYSGRPPPWSFENPLTPRRCCTTPRDALRQTPGGPWARFNGWGQSDGRYIGSSLINGMEIQQFLDNVIREAVTLGPQLLDAGDTAAIRAVPINSLNPTIRIEDSLESNAHNGGPRLSIDYTGLLLNSPQIHSRYFGKFTGVIIADVAIQAFNPIETYSWTVNEYDPRFDRVPLILPALSSTILDVH